MKSQPRYEFPIHRARRHQIEGEYYRAKRRVESQSDAGNADSGTAALMERYWEELQELIVMLNYFDELNYRESQGWRSWQTIILIIVAALSIVLSLFSIWRG